MMSCSKHIVPYSLSRPLLYRNVLLRILLSHGLPPRALLSHPGIVVLCLTVPYILVPYFTVPPFIAVSCLAVSLYSVQYLTVPTVLSRPMLFHVSLCRSTLSST